MKHLFTLFLTLFTIGTTAAQRSSDGLNFTQIGEIKGNGTTNTPHNYTFTDATPALKINYYRLRQTDFNGKETVSTIVSVTLDKSNLTLKNTLVHQTLSIVAEEATTIDIYNLMGQLIHHQTLKGSEEIDVSHWLSGAYLVRTSTGEALKFVKE